MVVINGHLHVVEDSGGKYVNGVPQAGEQALSDAIPCNISGSGHKDNKSGDVSYTKATYEVLIDSPCDFYADEVVLFNSRSRLGTFRVQDIQYLDYVDAIKITCERYAD